MNILLALVTVILVLTSLFMVLVILMQRAKSDGGVGAALGGGMAESAFGGETGNVLSRATTYAAILFFVLAFGLYLGRVYQHRQAAEQGQGGLPTLPELMPQSPDTSTMPEGPEGSSVVPPEGGTFVLPPAEGTTPSTETPATDAPATPPADAPAPSGETPADDNP